MFPVWHSATRDLQVWELKPKPKSKPESELKGNFNKNQRKEAGQYLPKNTILRQEEGSYLDPPYRV